ncbi:FRS (FAR1 Related Sequences) transcription factor family [Trifolium repens]|nr:FRS (FAR1 Related Sequences) transcription factor family [Trifolium repens]
MCKMIILLQVKDECVNGWLQPGCNFDDFDCECFYEWNDFEGSVVCGRYPWNDFDDSVVSGGYPWNGFDFDDSVVSGSMGDTVNAVSGSMDDTVNEEHRTASAPVASPKRDVALFEGDKDFEPPNGIEFESHEAAYTFYQEYAKSMGFTTSIKNSRRSKKTKEFIDAKFACSRYGVTPESDSGSSRRPSVKKTDCKACMHVKKKADGKWTIHEFIKDHNHELLPALAYHFRIHRNVKLAEKNNIDILHAVSERTRKMYVEMSRQSGGCQNIGSAVGDMNYQFDRGQFLALDEGDAQVMLEYDEEAIADFDTLHKQPALKSPSPWEKQMSTVYTHAIFKKFQVEVLGVAGCQSRIEVGDGTVAKFIVQDYEKDEEFLVTWNELSLEVTCFCRLFEYKGFLCRHALSVLQRCGCSSVPSQYIMKRWTKDAKIREPITDSTRKVQTRAQRYNDLCKRAIELSEEGSLSEESYNVAIRTLVNSLKNCVHVNNSNGNGAEAGNNGCSLREAEENQSTLAVKPSKKRNTTRKRKVQQEQHPVLVDAQDNLQQMDNLGSDAMNLNGYYGTQQNVQGLHVQLNLMEPPQDGYYVNQQSMQGLGPLNSMGPSHDGFFGTQQSIHGMGGQLEYRPTTSFGYSLQDEHDPHFHSNNSRNT